MAIMSSYFWASFPFDNLCENDFGAPPGKFCGRLLVKDIAILPLILSSFHYFARTS